MSAVPPPSTGQLKLYEEIATLSTRMVDAADENDWEALSELERHVAALRDVLMASEDAGLSTLEMEQKRILIQRILANDARVRERTEPWMEQVRRFLGASANQRRVANAYGTDR